MILNLARSKIELSASFTSICRPKNKKETSIVKLVEIYCDVDDFYRVFVPEWEKQLIRDGARKRACRNDKLACLSSIHLQESFDRNCLKY